MAAGDWVSGTTIQLSTSQTSLVESGIQVMAKWYALQPSGRQVWCGVPGGQPFSYTSTNMDQTIQSLTGEVAQALANAEGIPVVLSDGTTVNPS